MGIIQVYTIESWSNLVVLSTQSCKLSTHFQQNYSDKANHNSINNVRTVRCIITKLRLSRICTMGVLTIEGSSGSASMSLYMYYM